MGQSMVRTRHTGGSREGLTISSCVSFSLFFPFWPVYIKRSRSPSFLSSLFPDMSQCRSPFLFIFSTPTRTRSIYTPFYPPHNRSLRALFSRFAWTSSPHPLPPLNERTTSRSPPRDTMKTIALPPHPPFSTSASSRPPLPHTHLLYPQSQSRACSRHLAVEEEGGRPCPWQDR